MTEADTNIPVAVGTPSASGTDAPALVTPPGAAPPGAGNGTGGGDGPGDDGQGSGSEPTSRRDRSAKRGTKRAVMEWAVLIVVAIVIAIVIKTFLFQAFYIPSASMEPTLMIGDRVLVNKLSYDLHDIHRGDIVVFAAGPNPEWHRAGIDDLVKRVVALPGETVSECGNQQICIDGKLLDEKYLPKSVEPASPWPSTLPSITAADGKSVLVCDKSSAEGTCKVPPGKVFVMGDNRGNSQDARANGPVKESSIVGRVFVRIWPPNRLGFL